MDGYYTSRPMSMPLSKCTTIWVQIGPLTSKICIGDTIYIILYSSFLNQVKLNCQYIGKLDYVFPQSSMVPPKSWQISVGSYKYFLTEIFWEQHTHTFPQTSHRTVDHLSRQKYMSRHFWVGQWVTCIDKWPHMSRHIVLHLEIGQWVTHLHK